MATGDDDDNDKFCGDNDDDNGTMARRRWDTTTMATTMAVDNDGNEVYVDGVTGDDDGDNDEDDGNKDGTMGSGATGYEDDDNVLQNLGTSVLTYGTYLPIPR